MGPRMTSRRPSRQTGFSLVELMVALALGLMLAAVIGTVFVTGKQTLRTTDALSRIQENARHVFETLSYDVRMAGFTGCAYATQANVLNNSADWDKDLFNFPLRGYEEGVDTFPADVAGQTLRGDVFTALRADNQKEYIVASHNPAAAQLHLTANHDLKQGEVLVATDCSHAAVFQMTNVNLNDNIDVVVHNTGAGSPGNCTKGLGLPVDCASPQGTSYTFAPGSRLLRLSSVAYYLRTNPQGEPALYRQRLSRSSGSAVLLAEEMAEGVENMQVRYGVDTTASADGAVDAYVSADQVAVVAPGVTLAEKWRRVLSVRVSLLLVSASGSSVTTKPQTYAFNGVTTTASDQRLRKVLDYTINVRNRP